MVSPLTDLLLSVIQPKEQFTSEDRLKELFLKIIPNDSLREQRLLNDCNYTGEMLTRLILGGRIAFEIREELKDLQFADKISLDRVLPSEYEERVDTHTFKGIFEGYRLTLLRYKQEKMSNSQNGLERNEGCLDHDLRIKKQVRIMGLSCSASVPFYLIDDSGDPVDFNRMTIKIVKKKINKIARDKLCNPYYFNFIVYRSDNFIGSLNMRCIHHRFGLELWFDKEGKPHLMLYQSWLRVANLYQALNKTQSMTLDEGKKWLKRLANVYAIDGEVYPEDTEHAIFGFGSSEYEQNSYDFQEKEQCFTNKIITCHFGKYALSDVEYRLSKVCF